MWNVTSIIQVKPVGHRHDVRPVAEPGLLEHGAMALLGLRIALRP